MRYVFGLLILLCLLPLLDEEYGWSYRAALFSLLLGGAIFIALGNCLGLIEVYRDHRRGVQRGYSMVHFLSAFFTLLAYFVYPGQTRWWILLIPALDLANWGLLYMPVFLLREFRKPRSAEKESERADGPEGS